ncbi:ABC transporter substrate-binding protein [Polycladidibacter hongkongensis]|uniref:ABC transporter substrate-binding protein n=1 Tax=Polycladidibacter hongkongensis TaxID=1647556 RepID=UPI00082F6793|nr:ABC transporter substrate-binding protein [Pseudovibrio hongkongensis]
MKKKLAGIAFAAALISVGSAHAAEKLTVLLDWFANPDHAPLVVAQQKGMFAAHGLEVELIEPADPAMPPKLVAAGQGDIAINYQPSFHAQIDEGMPLVRIGTLVSTPLNTLTVLADGPVQNLGDLKGKRVGYSVSGFEDAMLGAMLKKAGLTLDDIELINVNFSLSPSLLAGQVDAVIGGYRNFELNQMKIEGVKGKAFYPEENGVPVYDELIYVAHKDRVNDERLASFMAAIEDATVYLLNHPQESWQAFIAAYPSLDDELNRLAWADTLPRFASRPAALDRGRYERFSAFLLANKLIKNTADVSTYAVELR